jgi:exodeoxyribonuclease VII small subunit
MAAKTTKTFEESLQELETIVARLERGDVPLEEALASFKAGMELSTQLQTTLTEAEKTLAKVMSESGAEVPFEGAE